MIPDAVPGVGANVPQRLVIGLAGENRAVRFNAHIVERGGAAFDAQVERNGVEIAVLGGGVPDQPLVVFVCDRFGSIKQRFQFGFRQPRAHGGAVPGVDQGVQADGFQPQLTQKLERAGDGILVQRQHGGVGHHVKFGGEHTFETGERLLPGTRETDHAVVYFRKVGFKGDLHMIQSGVQQGLQIGFIAKPASVGIDAGDLSVLFGVPHQFGQVVAQGGLAARKDDVRDADLPEMVENFKPGLGIQLRVVARAGVVAMRAGVVAAVGDGQVHAVGRGRGRGERRRGFKIQLADRAVLVGDQSVQLRLDARVIPGNGAFRSVKRLVNRFGGVLDRHFVQGQVHHRRRGRVELVYPVGVDDQKA